jgi:hypothetical protein
MEKERTEGQGKLAKLPSNSRQIIVHSGHNMELEAPEEVTAAIHTVLVAARNGGKM